jgi:hypothetical protein
VLIDEREHNQITNGSGNIGRLEFQSILTSCNIDGGLTTQTKCYVGDKAEGQEPAQTHCVNNDSRSKGGKDSDGLEEHI